MKNIHRFTAVICAIILVALTMVSAAAEGEMEPSLDNFGKVNSYTKGTFEDVSAGDWFNSNVAAVYEYGLMVGTQEHRFSPDLNLTIAEVVTIAARTHSIYYTGSENFHPGNVWYSVYLEYAEINGILTGDVDISDPDKPATRAQVAKILNRILPDEVMQPINEIKDNEIPDVSMENDCAPSVYKLYRTGILTGNDEYGSFYPDSTIRRSEMAALATRLVDEGLRLNVKLVAKPAPKDSGTKQKTYSSTEETIYHFLRDNMGMTPVGACAIMGNIAQECSYNYNMTTGSYYGLIQWGGSRKSNLISWCGKNGYDYRSLEGQLNFFKYEMSASSYKTYIDQMNALPNTEGNIRQATDIFLTYVERAGVRVLDKRTNFALEAWERFGQNDGV